MAWVGTAPRRPRHAPGAWQTPGRRGNAPRVAGEGQPPQRPRVTRWGAETQSRPRPYHANCPANRGDAG